jgi:transposase
VAGCSTSWPGRTAKALQTWLDDRDPAWLAPIREVTIDPYAGYKTAVAGPDGRLQHGRLIADHCHRDPAG